MQEARAGLLEAAGDLERIEPVARRPGIIALGETHDDAVAQIDGRQDVHQMRPPFASSRKAARIESPTSPLFSGWNWQPHTFPVRTIAGTSMP